MLGIGRAKLSEERQLESLEEMKLEAELRVQMERKLFDLEQKRQMEEKEMQDRQQKQLKEVSECRTDVMEYTLLTY